MFPPCPWPREAASAASPRRSCRSRGSSGGRSGRGGQTCRRRARLQSPARHRDPACRHRDAVTDERVPERAGRKERRRECRPALRPVDDQRRQRGRFATDEGLLPAGGATLRVVERLVSEHPSRSPSGSRARGSSPPGVPGRPSRASDRRTLSARDRHPRWRRHGLPTPYTSVWKRYPIPRRLSAAQETGIFSFDAGATGSDSLCAKTTVPVDRSTASAAVRPSESDGAVSAFASFDSSPAGRAAAAAVQRRRRWTPRRERCSLPSSHRAQP